MASNEVKIKVIIDGHTHSLNAARKDVNELGKSLANTDTVANALKGTFGKIALSLGGISALGLAFKNVAASGIEANRSFENLKIQLTGLISANSSNVSILGKTLDAHSKWNLGMSESEKILKKLNETNAKTKFTLEEIAGAFNMFYATSAGQGSKDKAVQAMDSIALAAQAVGKNIRDLTPMMDSLATGTVIAASEMGSFMKIAGLTNEELKKAGESGKLYEYIIEKLAKFKELSGEAANGYEVALGSLKNELTELNKELSKPMFEALTAGISSFSNLLRENKEDLIKYGGYAIETAKHLSILAGSFIAAKSATVILGGGFSLIKSGLSAATAMMPAFTSSLTLGITTGVMLEKGLAALNRAFATLLPVATIYLIYESIDAIKTLNGNLEDGAKNLNSVQKWIHRFLDSFATQLQIGQIKIYQFANDLKILGLKAKEFFAELNANYNPFSDGEGLKSVKKDIALLEEYNKSYSELIEKYKKDAVSRELNLQGFNLDSSGNIINDVNSAKNKIDGLKDSIDKLGNSANNAGKRDINSLKSALKEIAEIDFSEIEVKTQKVIDRYNEMLGLGIGKGEAKRFLNSKLEAIANENLKAVEKSEAEIVAKQLELRSEYYKTVGDYEKAWQIEKVKIIEKYEKLTFANGEKLTKEQLDKLLKIEKAAFLQGSKIAANSFKDIKGSWADTVSTMSKTVEEKFFDFFIGKTKSLKTALKDLGTNLFRDMISPYARTLSQGLAGGFGALLGGGSNLASIATNLGLSKSDSGSFIGTIGNTAVEIASDGQIIKGADALDKSTTSLLSSISNLKSAYSLLSGGYSGIISNFTSPIVSYGGQLINLGWSNTGSAIGGFGSGIHGTLTGSLNPSAISGLGAWGQAGYIGGGALTMGGIGYAAGTLGDKLTGTQTKAGLGGAIGGGIGGGLAAAGLVSNPVGWIIGAVGLIVGSFISKAKTTDAGLFLRTAIGAALDENISASDIKSYTEKTKKNWWRKKVSWEYGELDSQTRALIEQSSKAVQMSLKGISATNGLVLSAGHFSSKSFLNENLALGALSSFTGLARNFATEDGQRGTIKKWNLSNIFAGIGQKKLYDAFGKLAGDKSRMALLASFYGAAPQLGLIDKTGEIAKTPAQIEAENQKLIQMRKSFEEYAKAQKKETIEVIIESLNSVNQSVFDLELNSSSNPIIKASKSIEKAIDTFKMASNDAFGEFGDILSISTKQFKERYLQELRNDFTKENLDRWNAAKQAYDAARKAQEEYTKSIISFTQQIASAQGGFYQAHSVDTTFLSYQNIHTRLRALVGALDNELGDLKLNGGNPAAWNDAFLNMSAKDMQEFLSSGNTELRKELVGVITEYKNLVVANGGKEGWIKPLADLEAINKQIDALKLAKKTEESLKAQEEQALRAIELQKEQLSILNLQKAAIEKLGNIAQRIRDQVIDRNTSPVNYANALKAAKEAYDKGDYGSKAFDNLNEAANHQMQYFEDTLETYEEYKLNMLKMAGEIEALSGKVTLSDIDKSIQSLQNEIEKASKKTQEMLKQVGSSLEAQLASLEAQRQQLISNSQTQIEAMNRLLGDGSSWVRYLKDILSALTKDANGNAPKLPNYSSGIENINNGVNTANGAYLGTALDTSINQIYLSTLGRSVEQAGLDYWRGKIQRGELSLNALAAELIKSAIAVTGSNNKQDWIEWYKSKGFKPFADGGIVTRPTKALIGEAGYSEAVIPLKDGRGLKVDMDGAFNSLTSKFDALLRAIIPMARDTREMALTIRNSSDGEKLIVEVVNPIRLQE